MPEGWIWREGRLEVFVLGEQGFATASASAVLSGIPLARVAWSALHADQTAATRAFRAELADA